MIPVEFDKHEPERIGTGLRHPCEVLVHPEQSLPPTGSGGSERDGQMDPDPVSGRDL